MAAAAAATAVDDYFPGGEYRLHSEGGSASGVPPESGFTYDEAVEDNPNDCATVAQAQVQQRNAAALAASQSGGRPPDAPSKRKTWALMLVETMSAADRLVAAEAAQAAHDAARAAAAAAEDAEKAANAAATVSSRSRRYQE